MAKQEEIREGIARIGLGGVNPLENAKPNEYGYKIANDILFYLHSQGVVIKVDKELPKVIPGFCVVNMVEGRGYPRCMANYKAVESLIEAT